MCFLLVVTPEYYEGRWDQNQSAMPKNVDNATLRTNYKPSENDDYQIATRFETNRANFDYAQLPTISLPTVANVA
jgi:hypothetical protein